jgi:putative transposase
MWLKPSVNISRICHLSKNLYNEGNYIIRQELFNTDNWIRYNQLATMLKTSENYKELTAKASQQTLRLLDRSWKGFFQSTKQWKKHPELFYERPGIPRYLKKDGEYIVIFTNQQAKIRDSLLKFPKKSLLLNLKIRPVENLKEVRIIPKTIGYVLEIVYDKIINVPKRDKNRIAGIDLGVRNLVTIADNIGGKPICVKGGVAKSINQYCNKELARLQSIYDKQKPKNKMQMKRLLIKHEKKRQDYLHKVSRRIVDLLVERNIGILVIGHCDDWKQRVNHGRRNNQTFVMMAHSHLIHMLQYKSEEQGIEVIIHDESHTSKCSFFDNESIGHHDQYVGKRKRGLFRTEKGHFVNADVNGALNIIRKAVPDASFLKADGIEGAVHHPMRLDIC